MRVLTVPAAGRSWAGRVGRGSHVGSTPSGIPPVPSQQLPKKAGEDEVKRLPCSHVSGDPG